MILKAIQDATEMDEGEYLQELVKIGFGLNGDEVNTGILSQLLNRTHPPIKPASERIKFDFPEDARPPEQALSILAAAANGEIPPDIAKMMLEGLNAVIQIQLNTDLKDRIAELERLAGLNQ